MYIKYILITVYKFLIRIPKKKNQDVMFFDDQAFLTLFMQL